MKEQNWFVLNKKGYKMTNKTNILGKRFGEWTVVYLSSRMPKFCFDKKTKKHRVRGYRYFYECICSCGNKKIVNGDNLVRGLSKSCGCKQKESAKKNIKKASENRWENHIKRKGTRLYRIWCKMKNRCYDKNACSYKDYGGRGINVCEEWMNDFENFSNWSFLNGYRDDLTIDRIDVNGNYEPLNCRWITMKEQTRNTRRNIFVEYNGRNICLAELSEIYGIKYHTILRRYRAGDRCEKLIRGVKNETKIL